MFRPLRYIKRASIAVAAFSAGIASTYFTVNKRTQVIDLGIINDSSLENVDAEYFNKFLTRLESYKDGDNSNEAFGLKANFDDFSISWPNNEIKIEGEIDLSMRSLLDLNITTDLDITYNTKTVDVGIGYVDKTLYLACKDFKIKNSFLPRSQARQEYIDMYDKIIDLFFDVSNEDGMQIDLQVDNVLDALLGSVDLSALTSSLGDVSITETCDDTYAYVNIDVVLDETEMNIELVLTKDGCGLVEVNLGTITIGDVSIKGGLDCVTDSSLKVLPFDDENYSYRKRGEFIDTFSYTNLIDDVFNLFKTRQIGLDLTASLFDDEKSYGVIEASVDLDASRYEAIDFVGLVVGPELFGISSIDEDTKLCTRSFDTMTSFDIIELMKDIDLNVGVKLSNEVIDEGVKKLIDYSNFNFAFFKNSDEESSGYLSFNEFDESTVMKAEIDIPTINYLISEIPGLVETIQKTSSSKKAAKDTSSLFDFITSSELITAINNGSYEAILDLIDNIENDSDKIVLTINLSTLGFGDDAKVILTIDASHKEDTNVLNIDVLNAKIGEKTINLSVDSRKFSKAKMNSIDNERASFDKLDFVEGTFQQIEQITNQSQLGFELNGSVKGADMLGFDFDGWAQLNYEDLNGIGSITLNEYKYSPTKALTPHTVDISIDDFGEDHSKNNMYFEYRDELKGRFTLETFDDIFDLIMKLVRAEDPRFTKFFAPILEKISSSVLMTAIQNENYLAISQPSLLKSIKQNSDGSKIQIVLSKELLMCLVDNDLTIDINFGKNAENKKNIQSISVSDFNVGGKNINFEIKLVDYDQNKKNPVDFSGNFLDFSDIAVLLEFGINTTALNVYHLTADVSMKAGKLLSLINFGLDFYVYVNKETTKVYGTIPGGFMNNYSELVFEPSGDDNDKIGGYFYIYRYHDGVFSSKEYYYRTDSKTFVANIADYLLKDFLGLSISIGNLNLGESKETDPKWENILEASNSFPAFEYTHTSDNDIWKARVNLEAITENDKLGAVEATIYGNDNNGQKYLTKVNAKMTIASILNVTANISLANPNANEKDWPASVEQRYQEIISIYKNLSSSQQKSASTVDGCKL